MNDQNDHAPAPGGQHQGRPHPSGEISYLPTREQRPRQASDEVRRRAAVIVDEAAGAHAKSEVIRQLRRLGVPGYRTDVIPATDLDALSTGDYELVHLATGEPAASAAIAHATARRVPVVAGADATERAPYLRDCALVLSPTRAADATLAELGVGRNRIARWEPGIDRELFGPARYSATAIPAQSAGADCASSLPGGKLVEPFNILCAGPLDDDCGLWLVVQAFLAARERDPRLQLVLIGCDGARTGLRAALGDAVLLLDCDDPEQLARVYASADLFVSPDTGDGFGESVLEAQASGLPVVAIDGSGPGELIESGRSGCLVAPDPDTLGAAIRGLARRATLRERLVTGALLAARERTWERALMDLAIAWERAVTAGAAEVTRAA